MEPTQLTFWRITFKTIIVHTVTYFLVGLLAYSLLDYRARFAGPALRVFMRQLNDPIVFLGPLLQPIRGILFGVAFYLLRDRLFMPKNGWLVMWVVLVCVGIFSTFGPALGSVEGMIYMTLPLEVQIFGLPEVLLQSCMLSFVLFHWVNHPESRWLNWLLGILLFLVFLFPILGILSGSSDGL